MARRLKHRKYASIVICLLIVGMLSSICLSNIPLVKASPGTVIYAGCRESTYGIDPFPSNEEWEQDIKTMASYWPGSTPTAIWIVGILAGTGTDYMLWTECNLQFPSDGGSYEHIIFDDTDFHEPYLSYFDTHGIKVWLQIEPGLADVPTLIDLVLNRYGSHTCVAGFGVDVEWHKQTEHNWGVPVTDALAENWEAHVKSHNSNYTLFLKHFTGDWLPPTYRGDIVFVDDSQQFSSLSAMVSEFDDWAARYYPNIVFFQFGYPADKVWWQNLDNPPKDIGDALDAAISNDMGLVWVDFTLRDVFPPPDTTPPAAPTSLTASAVSSSQIDLDWANNTEPDLASYNVYRSTISGFTPGTGTFVASTTVSNYSNTGLSASTTYYYKVTAVDTSSNESTPSAQASATTQAAPTGGWDFQGHTYTHPFLTQLTEAEIQSELQQVNSDFQANLGYTPDHHAYPYGDYNATVESVVAQYRLTGRCAWAVTGSHNTYPMADWYEMNAVEIRNTTAVSTITGHIDEAITHDALLNIYTHRVMDPAPTYGCTPATLRAVCDYLLDKQNAGQLQVLPMRDAYSSWDGTKAVVVLSFDDGYTTDYTTTWGILTNEYGFIGTSYIFTQAIDEGWSDYMSWAQVQEMAGPADTTPPAAPTGLTATAVSTSQIDLDWNNNTEPDLAKYNVYRSTTSGFTPGPGNFVADTTVSNYSDTGLSASTTYYYKVTAVDTSGNESSPSAQASETTQSAPTRIEAESGTLLGSAQIYSDSAASGGQAVGWIDSAGNGVQFTNFPAASQLTIRYATINNGTLSLYVNNTHTADVSFTSTGAWSGTYADKVVSVSISAGATVKFQFDSGDVAVNLDYIEPSGAPDTTPPAAPTSLTASAVSSSQIDLDWNNNTEGDLDHYSVYRSTTSGFTPGPGNFVAQTTSSNYSDTGLSASTTYYYKVTAVDTSGNESSPSAQASATTEAAPPPPTMTAYYCDVDTMSSALPMTVGGYLNSKTEATSAQYTAIGSSDDSRWTTPDPGWRDEVFLWLEMYTDMAVETIGSIELHFEGYLSSESANFSIWARDLVNGEWDRIGTTESIATGADGTITRTITVDIANYIDADGKIIWGVYEDADSRSLNIDYVKMVCYLEGPPDTTPPAAPTGLTATAVSTSQIDLDWNNNTEGDLDHYSVYRSTTSGFTPGPGNFVAQTTSSNYSDTGLSASTTYYYKVTAVDTSGNESNPSAQASATTEAAPPPVTHAGVRSSSYGISPFPSAEEWESDMKEMASYWPGSQPTGIWLVGLMEPPDVLGSTCHLEFPEPAGGPYTNITFESTDLHESYLDYFDTHGIDVWLQVEPGDADMGTLIDLVLDQYGHHSCVKGFGLDVEWYTTTGASVTDSDAQTWESRVTSHDSNYTLFIKFWNIDRTPPSYRGDIIFVDDSQQFSSLAEMVSEFANYWAPEFYPNPVWFQYGYEADRSWWEDLANPPKDIGDAIDAEVPQECGFFWVDFTLRDVFPPPDTTPPAAPTGLTATAVSSSQINLDWNNNTESDLDHYNVYRSTTSGFTPGTGTFVAQTTSSSYSDTGLSASTTYYYKVTAVDTSGNEGSASNEASATTEAPPTANLALNQPAYASSIETTDLGPEKAVDGNLNTRWASHEGTDPEWIYVDLGSSKTIGEVILKWEVAYGKAYQIQVSDDAQTWTDVYSTTTGNGGTDDITFDPVAARYVRMYGTQRGTQYGYSLWEFEVYA